MSPIIKEYLDNNVGKVIDLEEYPLWLLFNEIMYDPTSYGIASVDPIGAYYNPGERHDELWTCSSVGVVMPEGTIVFNHCSTVKDLPDPKLYPDDYDGLNGYEPHEEEFRWWLWGKHGSEALSHRQMKELEALLLKEISMSDVAARYIDVFQHNNIVSVELRLGYAKFVFRVPRFAKLEQETKLLMDWQKGVKENPEDYPKGMDTVINFITHDLKVRDFEKVSIQTYREAGLLEILVIHGE